jgi:hypothetical protein
VELAKEAQDLALLRRLRKAVQPKARFALFRLLDGQASHRGVQALERFGHRTRMPRHAGDAF